MNSVEKKYDIGVIIGRFQINRLHDAHRELINSVIERHDKVIIFLGVSKAIATRRNPLDFASREVMIREEFGDRISTILPLPDMKDDYLWSKQVDNKVREVFPMGTAVLYGARDSFLPYYKGVLETIELEATQKVSATSVRKEVSNKVEKSEEFRSGVIYSAYSTYPVTYPTVDVAVMDGYKILMGRKSDENKFRFIGGFVDVTDKSYEDTAIREVEEETGLIIKRLRYMGSLLVNDWRYRSEEDRSVTTLFFRADYIEGTPVANDDIEEVRWFLKADLNETNLVEEHLKLLEFLK